MKQFIHRFYRLSLITFTLLALVLLAACGPSYSTPTPAPAPPPQAPVTPAPAPVPTPAPAPVLAPAIQMTSPSGSVQAGDITVSVQVSDFSIVNKLGQANVADEGHIHYFLDVDAATTPGKPAVTAAGTYAATVSTSYTWKNVAAGTHTFSAELINNDHTPLVPPIVATMTITVLAAPSVSTPTPAPTPTPTSTTPPPQYTIDVATKATIGTYLVDSKGMTLYYTTLDTTFKSNITDLATWPIFNSSNITVPASLTASNFSSITRNDGSKQTTYKGWPLYYYVLDKT
ncbi:MAG: hypothetical protein Q7R34_05560, partial [Dehalococcoidia bacterium]|nr:hypothetical protein [Dehalococcoidia bacterium]